jgi:hypothetical protein
MVEREIAKVKKAKAEHSREKKRTKRGFAWRRCPENGVLGLWAVFLCDEVLDVAGLEQVPLNVASGYGWGMLFE